MWPLVLGGTSAFVLGLSAFTYAQNKLNQRRIKSRTASWLSELKSTPPTSSPWYRRRILLFVNPYSGHGLSETIYRTLVEPVFEQHQIDVTVVETQRANHAGDYIADKKNDLSQFSLCLLISGDGLVNEVLNALTARFLPPDMQPSHPDFHSALKQALHILPIALLPGGTSNGLATSLFGHVDVVSILQRIMSTSPRSVDIMSIQSPFAAASKDPDVTDYSRLVVDEARRMGRQPQVKVDVLTFLYGVVADNDNFAERTFRSWPFLLRTTLAPLCAIALNRSYRATIRFRPLSFTSTEQQKYGFTSTDSLPRWSSDRGWCVLDANWCSWVVCNVPWPASDVLMCPGATIEDGAIYACVLRKNTSLFRKLWIFSMLSDGSHTRDAEVEYFKIKEFVVYPASSRGHMILSGEELPVQSLHGQIQPRAASIVF